MSIRCPRTREHDYIAFDEYYNEPIGRSFGNCDIYNTTITWLRKHDHMARYFPISLVFGAKFQYFDRENDYIAFDEYYNEPIGRSFGNCEIPFVTS